MRRSNHSRTSTRRGPGRRVLIAATSLVVFGGLVGVSQISGAQTEERAAVCESEPPATTPADPSASPAAPGADDDRTGDDATPTPAGTAPAPECEEDDDAAPTPTPTASASNGGLQILGNDCEPSSLQPHTGFQEGSRCVSTAFGEVNTADKNPSLVIAEAPRTVDAGETFQLVVSTRNLVRDRFLPAGQGGYYRESAVLDADGLVRGHFHTACRILETTDTAVDPSPVPAFFVATEDGNGGEEPDSVIITVPGLPEGVAQCASWAGDGSHRIPMMERANQLPALDAVRIQVRPAEEEEPPAEQPGEEEPPAEQPGEEEPPAEQPGEEEPPAEQPGEESPPAEQPEDEEPPAEQPGQEEPPAEQPQPQQPDQGNGPDEQEEDSPGGAEPAIPVDEEPTAAEPAEETPAAEPTAPAANLPDVDPVADGGNDNLAFTGTNTFRFLAASAVLILVGMAITFATRRRRIE